MIGVDVSRFNQPSSVDWTALVRAGVRFAIIRASSGLERDPAFEEHLTRAQGAGVAFIGGYHYLRELSPPAAQAQVFQEACAHVNGIFPALDVEPADGGRFGDPQRVRASVIAWIDATLSAWGRHPIIYLNDNTARQLRLPADPLALCELWVAHFGVPVPAIPEPWASAGKRWLLWQKGYTGPARPHIDLDICSDEAAFIAFVNGPPSPASGLPCHD